MALTHTTYIIMYWVIYLPITYKQGINKEIVVDVLDTTQHPPSAWPILRKINWNKAMPYSAITIKLTYKL